ncbi:LicD family protein [Lactococcus fujiensis]|uniref:Lipopolysaccharide cholinephosphotransferase LicD1 n=1 Tax=Lactococcus fujiensis JCM 16395 TaxID=1291764 RepID=A0A2A5RMD0_9LACT|nr:LicD family protein [Lactococcus fujiensis]PCS00436.1 Lipopolysaccharide cholinephosphotransferase LicD1 [Lactococcus fujiensis JCM 16395]
MKEITKEELKTIQLEIISYVDSLCRQHQIEYSISAGTLLGAVKYRGYIPWDDDIDIMLTRPNYEKLLHLLSSNLPQNLSLLYFKVQPTFLPMSKLYDNRTFYRSSLDKLNNQTGIFIDIFPIDSLPNNEKEGERFKQAVRKEVTNLTSTRAGLAYASSEKLIYSLAKSVLWLPAHLHYRGKNMLLAEKVDALMQKYNNQGTLFCNYVFSPPKKTAYFPKLIFKSYEDIHFENLILRKITNHKPYLDELYHSWQLPPKKRDIKNHAYYHWYWKSPPK